MRVHVTVVAAIAVMVGTVAAEGGQPQKRSVLRYSPKSGPRSVVRPVTFNDESYAQEPPIHQPPQVSAYTPAATRRVISVQHGSQDASTQAGEQLFVPPQTRGVNYGQTVTSDTSGGYECQGAPSPCCGSPCCASSCCAPSCCAPTCCRSTCCGSILPKLFGGHCGCGHQGCCGSCGDCCGQQFGSGCGNGCHDCCACPCAHGVDLFGWWNTLFGPCCRSHCGDCGCGGCHPACDCGCSGCGGCAGYGAVVVPGPVNKVPIPNNGSPSDVPPPPKVP